MHDEPAEPAAQGPAAGIPSSTPARVPRGGRVPSGSSSVAGSSSAAGNIIDLALVRQFAQALNVQANGIDPIKYPLVDFTLLDEPGELQRWESTVRASGIGQQLKRRAVGIGDCATLAHGALVALARAGGAVGDDDEVLAELPTLDGEPLWLVIEFTERLVSKLRGDANFVWTAARASPVRARQLLAIRGCRMPPRMGAAQACRIAARRMLADVGAPLSPADAELVRRALSTPFNKEAPVELPMVLCRRIRADAGDVLQELVSDWAVQQDLLDTLKNNHTARSSFNLVRLLSRYSSG